MALTTTFFLTNLLSLIATSYAAAPETVYLSNCESRSGSGTFLWSELDFYAAGTDSQNGEVPSSSNICITHGYPSSGDTQWEGSPVSCKFSTGVTFTANIASNAQSLANYAYVGSASNGFHTYNCYKDDQRQLYVIDDGEGVEDCDSIYYCLAN